MYTCIHIYTRRQGDFVTALSSYCNGLLLLCDVGESDRHATFSGPRLKFFGRHIVKGLLCFLDGLCFLLYLLSSNPEHVAGLSVDINRPLDFSKLYDSRLDCLAQLFDVFEFYCVVMELITITMDSEHFKLL